MVVEKIQELSRVELQRRAERTPFILWRVSGGIISLSAHNRLYLYLYLHCIAFVLYCIVFHPMELVKRNHIMSQITFSLKGAVWGMMLDYPVCCNIVALVILL